METKYKLFLSSFIQAVFVISLINIGNILFELIKANDILVNLSYENGYFTFNERPIGMHMISSLISLLVLAIFDFNIEMTKAKFSRYL